MAPMVRLGSCPHRLHLPCYAALRVRVGSNLRCPACRTTVTLKEADRMASRQHSNEVMLEALSIALHEMPAEGGRGAPTRTTRSERGRRAICSICHGLIEETAIYKCPCDIHRRCAVGFCEDVIPRARYVGRASQVTCPSPALHEEHHEVDIHPLLEQIHALGRSADTTEERAIRERETAPELRLLRKTHTRNGGFVADDHRARRGLPRRTAWGYKC